MGKAAGEGVTGDGEGEGIGVGGDVGDGGTGVRLADGDGGRELSAAGAIVPCWHAASNEPRAPKLKPTNRRRESALPESAFSLSLSAFSA